MRALFVAAPALAAGSLVFFSAANQEPVKSIGSYVTPVGNRSSNQRHNAQLVLTKINGVRVAPGETFSFNETVGPWSRDRGYRRAPVSFGGQLVDAWGGGVCQTSSTLYNAALVAGLEIIERHPHHYAPSYIQPGRDAAVAFPNIDLKFKNSTDHEIELQGKVAGGRLFIEITSRGEKPAVAILQRPIRVTRPGQLDLTVRGAKRYVRNPGKSGYEVETIRVISGKKEFLSRDSYPMMNQIIDSRSTM